MNQTTNTLIIAGGATVAALGFVAVFLYYQQAPSTEGLVGTDTERAPETGADQASWAQVDEADYRTLDGGLKVADLVVGTGVQPVAGQVIDVHYSGWLQSDGTQFDSSLKRGEPISFQLEHGGVIRGWHRGIEGMKVGGKRQLVIPPELAYGPQGRPPVIPPASTLVFDVELVSAGELRVEPDAPTDQSWASASRADQGVQYVDLKVGTGEVAQDRAAVTVEMSVWQESGELFFTSYHETGPKTFMIGGQGRDAAPLTGIEIAAKGMQAGGSRIARLPAEVAFGERGFRDQIPPNAVILVQLDVTDVKAPRIGPTEPPGYNLSELTTTGTGLKYVDIEPGSGTSPEKHDLIYAEYTGWLDDGTIFDSSYNRAKPFEFPLGRGAVIKAWDEAVSTMKPGGKRLIIAPPELAYGDRGQGDIPPGATLTFLIELDRFESR